MWNTVGPSLRTLWTTKMCKRDQSLLWGKTVLFLFSTNTGGWDAWRGGGRGPWRGLLFNWWSSSSSQINLSSFQKHPKTSTKVLPKRKTSVFAELPAGNKILLREPYVLHHKHDAEPCKDAGVLAGLPFTDWSPEQTVLYKSQGRVHALCLCLMLSACWLMPAGPFLFHFVVLTLTVPGERHTILSLGILGSAYVLCHVRDCGFRVTELTFSVLAPKQTCTSRPCVNQLSLAFFLCRSLLKWQTLSRWNTSSSFQQQCEQLILNVYTVPWRSKALSACVVIILIIPKWKHWFLSEEIIRTCST